MSGEDFTSCVASLEENSNEIYLETTTVLLKLANNVIREPTNPKFRIIRLSNATVANKLLPSIGAMECLFMMGFKEGEDSLILPNNSLLENLKKIRDEISNRRSKYLTKAVPVPVRGSTVGLPSVQQPSTSTSQQSATSHSRPTGSAQATSTVPYQQSLSSLPMTTSKSQQDISFLKKIENNFTSVLQYEDVAMQAKARKLIPITELEIAAMKNMRNLQLAIKRGKTKEAETDIQDFVLIELLNWFKTSFFKWVDAPECDKCAGPTKFVSISIDVSNPMDTHRVEMYDCVLCKGHTLFPRYNSSGMLLKTRRGRCGEWANCFTLFCRTLGWDTRYVVDESDHVWTEVYSCTQGRWLHCDPCENTCDSPLMYEHGWGKELSYVIAYSRDEIQDVTWRYSSKHSEILKRRTQCSEEALLATVTRLKRVRQASLSAARRAFLDKRLLKELVEFLVAKHPTTETERGGRSSGSLAWRLARGEIGQAEAEAHIWTPCNAEIELGKMQIVYSTAEDKYSRLTGTCDSENVLKSFQNGAFEVKSMLRKEEKDWKKVYLARTEGSELGSIKWKFDLSGKDVVVDTLQVVCRSKVFESGKVLWLLCAEDSCVRIDPDKPVFDSDALRGATSLILTAELSGGEGNQAWQHAQLFRQDLSDPKIYPLDITITFRKK